VNVVAAAFVRVDAMTSKTPDAIDALNTMEQAGFMKSRKCPVEGNPIKIARFGVAGNLLVREWPIHLIEHFKDDSSSLCPAQTRSMQKLNCGHLVS
jgi:hypothetical protein